MMGPICCPETSARNYYYNRGNIPEERKTSTTKFHLYPSSGVILFHADT